MEVNEIIHRRSQGQRALLSAVIAGAAAALVGGLTGNIFLRSLGAAVGFGLAPGLAAAMALGPTERGILLFARAAFLSPLLAGAGAVLLLLAGVRPETAATILLFAGYAAALGMTARPHAGLRGPSAPRYEKRLLWWLAALALVVIVPHLLREWVRIRSDAWFHTAVVLEIGQRGVPPGDPYFAGLRLQYMWFYHALLAVWSVAAGVEAWDLGGLLNALWLFSLGGAAYAISRRVGRPGREAFFAAVFVPLGFGALFYAWFPIKLARALVGETAGWAEVQRVFSLRPFTLNQVFQFTSFLGSPPALLNKYLVMTALGGAITALAWLAEGVAGCARRPSPRWVTLTALASFGSWVWNPALGLPGAVAGLLAGAWLLLRPGKVERRAILQAAFGAALGAVAALPLLLTVAMQSERPFPLGLGPAAPAILVSSLAALGLGLPALARSRFTHALFVLRVLAVAMMGAAFVVILPDPNTRDKMPVVFYLLPAVAAGWMLGRLWKALRRRGHRRWAWALVLVLLVPMSGLCLAGYLFDPADPPPTPTQQELYGWLAAHTPPDAVILDTAERADVLVRVPRRQYWGREAYAKNWGYAHDEMNRRRRVRDVFEGPPGPWDETRWRARVADTAAVARAVGILDTFRRRGVGPVYVLWRPADHGGLPAEATVMARLPDRFRRVWSGAEATVYRFVAKAASEGPGGGRASTRIDRSTPR